MIRFLFLLVCLFFACCNVATAYTREEILKQTQELVKQQQAELDNAIAKQNSSLDTISKLATSLFNAQVEINKVGSERDGWKAAYEKQSINLAKAQKHVAYLITTLTLLGVAMAGYFVAKFYFHLPI